MWRWVGEIGPGRTGGSLRRQDWDLEEACAAAYVGGRKPWLVLKSSVGRTYDMDTRKWGWYGWEKPSQGEEWARRLSDVVRAAPNKGIQDGILVCGCSKTGDKLRALDKLANARNSSPIKSENVHWYITDTLYYYARTLPTPKRTNH